MDIRVFKEDFHTTDYLSTKGQARHRSIPKKKKIYSANSEIAI